MIYSTKKNKKNAENCANNLDEFTRAARKELIKYAADLWNKHLSSKYEDPYWRIKLDTIDKLNDILYRPECRKAKLSLIEALSPLIEFRSELTDFKFKLLMRNNDTLFIKPPRSIANFFKFKDTSQRLIQKLETLVKKTEKSIYLSSYRECFNLEKFQNNEETFVKKHEDYGLDSSAVRCNEYTYLKL